MVVRITKTADGCVTTLHVDGRLHSGNADGLRRECRSIEGPVVLDLSDLRWVDATAVDVLIGLISKGARIRGASPYIALRLKENVVERDEGDPPSGW